MSLHVLEGMSVSSTCLLDLDPVKNYNSFDRFPAQINY